MSTAPNPSHPSHLSGSQAFVPKDVIPVKVGHTTVNLYPKVTADTSIPERAHAHHVNVTALKNANLSPALELDTLGFHQMASTIVDGHKHDFKKFFDRNWYDMANCTILSFHSSTGAIINDATIAADPAILKDVQDGAVNACRPADVRYVRLQSAQDFRDMCPAADAADNTVLRAAYYVELPQGTQAVTNANGAVRQLTTFLGVADLRTLSKEEFQRDILANVPQVGPMDLVEAPFNVPTAATDEE
eukprot:scaffold143282_cov76-Cyclotella_meneghiniana.AAC.1